MRHDEPDKANGPGDGDAHTDDEARRNVNEALRSTHIDAERRGRLFVHRDEMKIARDRKKEREPGHEKDQHAPYEARADNVEASDHPAKDLKRPRVIGHELDQQDAGDRDQV